MNENKEEFVVPIVRHGYGYVRVRAKSLEEANNTIKGMTRKRLLSFFKGEYEFIEVKKAEKPNGR
jgi:hypothetical protein